MLKYLPEATKLESGKAEFEFEEGFRVLGPIIPPLPLRSIDTSVLQH